MDQMNIDSEEMARRHDEDFIASLKMVGEGGPNFDSKAQVEAEEAMAEDRKLPRAYQ